MTAASATDLRRPAELEPRFAAVYLEHVDYVWTNLRRLGVPWTELEDAVQETFIVAFRRWDDFDTELQWRSWLFGIARRVASHHRRGSGRRLRLVEAVHREPVVDASDDPDEVVARQDAARLVQHFLETLSPRRREVFILAEIEGMTGANIAQTLGLPANTVWSRLRAGRESFARYLQTLRARERGAAERLDRAALLRRARRQRVPADQRRTMMAALAVELALPGAVGGAGAAGSAAATGWLAALKPTLVAIGISVGTLASIGAGARIFGNDTDVAHEPAASKTSRDAGLSEPAEPPRAAAPARPETPPRPVVPPVQPAAVAPTPAAIPAPARTPEPGPTATNDLAAELVLIARMRDAAAIDVLELADQHRRDFPRGELAIERDLLRIAALCRLDRNELADEALTRFRRSHPDRPIPPAVASACKTLEKKPTKPDRAGQ